MILEELRVKKGVLYVELLRKGPRGFRRSEGEKGSGSKASGKYIALKRNETMATKAMEAITAESQSREKPMEKQGARNQQWR